MSTIQGPPDTFDVLSRLRRLHLSPSPLEPIEEIQDRLDNIFDEDDPIVETEETPVAGISFSESPIIRDDFRPDSQHGETNLSDHGSRDSNKRSEPGTPEPILEQHKKPRVARKLFHDLSQESILSPFGSLDIEDPIARKTPDHNVPSRTDAGEVTSQIQTMESSPDHDRKNGQRESFERTSEKMTQTMCEASTSTSSYKTVGTQTSESPNQEELEELQVSPEL